jgi:hypothetical protein
LTCADRKRQKEQATNPENNSRNQRDHDSPDRAFESLHFGEFYHAYLKLGRKEGALRDSILPDDAQLLINAVVSMGRCNTQLKPTFIENES